MRVFHQDSFKQNPHPNISLSNPHRIQYLFTYWLLYEVLSLVSLNTKKQTSTCGNNAIRNHVVKSSTISHQISHVRTWVIECDQSHHHPPNNKNIQQAGPKMFQKSPVTLPETNSKSPWKRIVGVDGILWVSTYFQGWILVSYSHTIHVYDICLHEWLLFDLFVVNQ